MIDKSFNITNHTWVGHGGPRGLVTHVWDRSFAAVMHEIELGGRGTYRFRFERIGNVAQAHVDSIGGMDAIGVGAGKEN